MVDLRGKKVAVLAGDRRMLEIMRQARLAGAEVVACAGAPGAAEVTGNPQAETVGEAVQGAHLIITPVPGLGLDDSLWTPNRDKPLYLSVAALKGAAPGCVMFMGRVSAGIGAMAEAAGVKAIAHGDDDAEALLHAVPTAEGAVRHAIEMSDVTIMGSKCVCTGFGRVGQSMAWLLRGMGANVTVCLRNPSQRARAWGFGFRDLPLEAVKDEVKDADFIFQSAAGQGGLILTREILANVSRDCVVIELSSPPSGTDLDACKEFGLKAVWARGQAGSAPRTAGLHEWQVMMRMYLEELTKGQ